MKTLPLLLIVMVLCAGCSRIENIGRAPEFNAASDRVAYAVSDPRVTNGVAGGGATRDASLWMSGRTSLLGDRRASVQGDILTVVVEIDESAEMENSSQRGRSGSESLAMPQILGIPQRLDRRLPDGASMADAVDTNSNSSSSGNGSTRRSESLTLRIAATIVDVLPNGVLQIEGSQEVRVNFELRELLISGFVRPEDISRRNEITYDKVASARISYGGRGQITDMQQPRYGQQLADIILPF
ncbi:flagellar basal body L-ring protein FlgH [Rhodobacteraceae bacterium XHP0102]|nr:flagellar basal body L-ring protein FlgH [Rhodobacteraceae bacterium XHP0102]